MSFSQDTVNYGAVGAFATDDNGLIRNAQGAITGVANPFRFTVSATCPNDHVIPFKLTMTARNGLDPGDTASYTNTSRFYLMVQRGRELPRIIDKDMTLTKEDYWLVPDGTLVNPGVTLTVTEGTQIQFFTSDPASPYANLGKPQIQVEGNLRVKGTAEEPVQLFPGPLFPSQPLQIRAINKGSVDVEYAEITNARFHESDIYSENNLGVNPRLLDHVRFYQDACLGWYVYWGTPPSWGCGSAGWIKAEVIRKSIFSGIGLYGIPYVVDANLVETSLFDSSYIRYESGASDNKIHDSVFLKNHARNANNISSILKLNSWHLPSFLRTGVPLDLGGKSYVGLSSESFRLGLLGAEQFARSLGGHVVTVRSADENTYIRAYQSSLTQEAFNAAYPDLDCGTPAYGGPASCSGLFRSGWSIIGVQDIDESGNIKWISGETTTFNALLNAFKRGDTVFDSGGGWYSFNWYGYPFWVNPLLILELPSGTTPTQLLAARQTFLESDSLLLWKHNAFLNDWQDSDIYHWMRFFIKSMDGCSTCREHVGYLSYNYWGTTSTQLIDAAIHDFNDDFNLGKIEYQPILTTAPETAYPFMVNAEVRNASGAVTGKVGAEPITLTVNFNRDMDTAKQPAVSFGPAEPYTDYVVPGQWVDARTWKGQFTITPITGDGMQSIRVAGAVAADDPWLVTGNDYGRFRFEIITSGAEAMTLQAKGRAGGVDLSWMQDDFDLLAGYHLYRSATENGSYSRVNATLIPAGQTSYADNGVEPGVTYFYKFTVVKTDFSESGFSNVASGTAMDSIAPVITHTPITSARPGIGITIAADITDNIAVKGATLYFRKQGTSAWTTRAMTHGTGNRWSASLEGSLITMPGLDYYLQATDGLNTARSGQADFPHRIAVEDRPAITSISPASGPAAGGTRVSLLGVNFKPGATSTLGGAACTTPTRVSATELTCTTPPHIPDTVDVKVINPDQASGVLLRGYTYQGATVTLGLPDSRGGQNTQVEVPINLANVAGLASAALTVTFDKAVLQVAAAVPGNLAPGWSLTANTGTPGQVALAMSSGGSPVTGSGTLVVLTFKVLGAPGSSSAMTPASVRLNDGAIPTNAAPGTFSVETVYQVAGAATFWNAARPIPGVRMTLEGERRQVGDSNAQGAYTLGNVLSGKYTLTPSLDTATGGISAYDAALVLRHQAGLAPLTGRALQAGDVNQNGAVTAHDAYFILRYAVGLLELPFEGAGTAWLFDPARRDYANLNANQTGQDFTGILLGDPSGSWGATEPASRASALATADTATLSLPELEIQPGKSRVAPISLSVSTDTVMALDLEIRYDPNVLSVTSVQLGAATSGWQLATDSSTPGRLRCALAGAKPLTHGVGLNLLRLGLTAVGGDGQQSILAFDRAQLNEGSVPAALDEGSITVTQQLSTTTSLGVSPAPVRYGNNLALIATVRGSQPGGAVTFQEGTRTLGTRAVSLGKARLDIKTLMAGVHPLTANYSGDANNKPSQSAEILARVNPAPLRATVTVADKAYDGTNVATITGCVLQGVLGADAVECDARAATARFADAAVGDGKRVTVKGLALNGASAGNYVKPGTTFATASITKAPQKPLLLAASATTIPVNGKTELSVSGGNGIGAVTYRLESGPCALSRKVLTGKTPGACVVTATKAGDARFKPVTSTPMTVTVVKAAQRPLTVISAATTIPVNGNTELSVSGGNGLGAVTYRLESGPCTLSRRVLTGKTPGACVVTATKAGDARFEPVTSALVTVTVIKAAQRPLTVIPAATTIPVNGNTELSVSGGSGIGAVTYRLENGPCTLSRRVLTGKTPGACVVTATKAGDTRFEPVTSAPVTVTVQ